MGIGLEEVLESLEEFRNRLEYWFECTGKEDIHISSQVHDLIQALKDHNEKT